MGRVLIATHVPYWRRAKGNQQRVFELVRFLSLHNAVTIFYIGADQPGADAGGARVLATNPHRGLAALAWRLFHLAPAGLQQFLVTALNRLQYRRPLASFRNERVLAQFADLCRAGSFDAVIVEYIWHGYLVEAVDAARTWTLLDVHDIFHRRVEDFARFGRVPDRTVTRDEELAVFRRFDYVLAIQRDEFAWLDAMLPGRVLLAMHPVEPVNGLYASRLASLVPGGKLVLVYFASFGDVNLDAIRWFVAEVWNEDLAKRFELHIYGDICASLRCDAPGVLVRGRVAAVADAYRHADIAINPARFGSGLKIKTIEALAHGVPVVTTPVGAEGLGAGAAGCLLRATDAGAFRAQLERLRDAGLRRDLSGHALAFVAQELTPAACFGPLQALIDE